MTIALTILIALLIVALVVRERDHDKTQAALAAGWVRERHELLNRIQRPELLPAHQGPPARVTPARDAREMAKVGAVSLVPPAQRPGGGDAA